MSNSPSNPAAQDGQAEKVAYEDLYQNGLGDVTVSGVAKECARKVLQRLTSIQPHSNASDITIKMQAAIASNDVSQILLLADELKTLKEQEDAHYENLKKMGEEFTFEEILSAYPEQLSNLAHELAWLAMETTQAAINKARVSSRSGTRKPKSPAKSFQITKGDQTMIITPNTGRPNSPGKDREAFEFLGFQVATDGSHLIPSVFTDKDGNEVNANSKKAIINDMLAGGPHWIDLGYSICEHTPESEVAS